ncbi:MAG: acireductone synthase [Cyanobacteria bacterium P01_H01_bin.58]
MAITDTVDAILLDIEGTTTPVDFVFGVLFPYARDRVASFLVNQGQVPEVQADLALLRQEYTTEVPTSDLPTWSDTEPVAAVPYIHYLMDCDRKSTGLKSLQGKLWNQGYTEGRLKSQLFEDVKPAIERWHRAGKRIYIYSSGSIQAQKLLFGNTEAGDLTPLLQGYFDTTTGPKKEAASYHKIAAAIALPPAQIIFISDVIAELKAAQAAGLQTLLSQRPGNAPQEPKEFTVITDFTAL